MYEQELQETTIKENGVTLHIMHRICLSGTQKSTLPGMAEAEPGKVNSAASPDAMCKQP